MDNNPQADRVDRYLRWRFVNAVETLAYVAETLLYALIFACCIYSAYLLLRREE
jgi:hypothetical protein